MGAPRKYKNAKERNAAMLAKRKKWYANCKKAAKAAGLTISQYWKQRYGKGSGKGSGKEEAAGYEARLATLEAEVANFKADRKEILLSLDECLKENKRLADLIKWGKK